MVSILFLKGIAAAVLQCHVVSGNWMAGMGRSVAELVRDERTRHPSAAVNNLNFFINVILLSLMLLNVVFCCFRCLMIFVVFNCFLCIFCCYCFHCIFVVAAFVVFVVFLLLLFCCRCRVVCDFRCKDTPMKSPIPTFFEFFVIVCGGGPRYFAAKTGKSVKDVAKGATDYSAAPSHHWLMTPLMPGVERKRKYGFVVGAVPRARPQNEVKSAGYRPATLFFPACL